MKYPISALLTMLVSLFLPSNIGVQAFTPSKSFRPTITTHTTHSSSSSTSSSTLLRSTPDDRERQQKLKSLGYSEDEIKKSVEIPKEDRKVRVDIVDDVDPLTLTAIGFAAIAFNFLVLGNLGDGGIGGLVATAINLFNQ